MVSTRSNTQHYKAQLRATLSPETYRAVCAAALAILETLPADVPLGTRTAGLMLAALAAAESAEAARTLVQA